MRILIVSQYFWPEAFRVNEIAAGLVQRGHDVTVLTGPPNYPKGQIFPDYRKDASAFASYEGAEIVRVPLVPRGSSKVPLLANYLTFVLSGLSLGAMRLRGREFDAILVFQVSPITSAIPALLQRRLKRAPVAMWILDLWPETLSAVGMVRSPRALRWVGRLVSAVYRRCDMILVQSEAFVASVTRHAPPSASVRYLPAWAEEIFEIDWAAVEPAPEIAKYADTFNIVFAGNIGEAQDFPTLLGAAEKLRERTDIRFLIVGDGRYAQTLADEIEVRKLSDRFILLGRFPAERMPGFFKGADALIVSLKDEPVFAMTIPGKVQSYMRSGKPVIAVLGGEGARVVGAAGAGAVCHPGDIDGLASAIAALAVAEPAELAAMGKRGQDFCKAHFDRTMLIDRLEGWLTELGSRRPR